MRLSASMIAEKLAKLYEFETIGQLSDQPTLSTLLLGDDQAGWEDYRLYLVEADQLAAVPDADYISTVLAIGTPSPEFMGHFSTVLLFRPGTPFVQLHNRTQEIFTECNKWDADIHRVLNIGSDVQNIVDLSDPMFMNPLVLIDSNFKPIAHSAVMDGDEAFAPVLDAMKLPFVMARNSQEPAIKFGEACDVIPSMVDDRNAYIISLPEHKYQVILIEYKKKLTVPDALLLSHLSGMIYLAVGVVPEYVQHSFSLAQTLSHYIDDQTVTHYLLESELRPHDWLSGQHYQCLKFSVEISSRKDRSLRFISERIANAVGQDSTFVREDSIVSFINIDLIPGGQPYFDEVLKEFLQDNFIKVGISNCFTGFENFRLYYLQADMALAAGIRLQPLASSYSFHDIIKQLLIEWCTTRLPAHLVCSPDVITLIEYDQQHDSELTNTLFVLLKNNINYTRTASELFIHRSTLTYRLDRIKQLIDIDYENIESQWYLLFSFELMGIR
ncbi:MAG: helix-turn-helix domain-containing protein [Coriobacteriia bacterium]|nr:helix-turn-helix domain-containing protein [Coriobacteriia bacterium]